METTQKTTQIMKISDRTIGKYSVVYRSGEQYNPYVLYRHTWNRETGRENKRIVAKYADIRSCLYVLSQISSR